MNDVSEYRPLRVVVAGLGQMGRSHALAYHSNPDYEIVGLYDRSPGALPDALHGYARLASFDAGLALKPDVVSICTYTDSHAELAIRALDAGAHVFVEKPLAASLDEAQSVVDAARRARRTLVIGYILRHHPSWTTFIDQSRRMGPPYVMRLNLNQQSTGDAWRIHKRLMETTPPIVDCGVHYVDVMCQITDARPVQVRGMGVRLTEEIAEHQVNYGHLQVLFEDGSLGWYEAGWGPMMSETACFVKDVIGPFGAVSIVTEPTLSSSDVDTHTKTGKLRIHRAPGPSENAEAVRDEWISMDDEPGHQDLCDREQAFLAEAIRSGRDLTRHHDDAIRSLKIALAAEQSMREGRAIDLPA
ncbi:Gfo/Idh/MocA family protein [Pararobbsia silviterrae]|uniref:Gfo/Idh/MocA family oxidoreductase n=1 Tax=Pararobbsia silviterrae TaxID=1792498 RepID=A0A494XMC6_9BURK|nr:Gfo/Idh/MocA family oxidoreductase [Pararobbsia silviterrae]RKP51840.1 gfo/Idh/MocA family oxidoreductase [Pararobbsia silviterrae]